MDAFADDHFQQIYVSKAAQYDALVSAEDYQGNLLPALDAIRPLAGLEVVEFGAGTGRLTRLLAPIVKFIRAYDGSAHMLGTAAQRLGEMGLVNWTVTQADNRTIPAEDASADLAIAGWTFGHSVAWYPDLWQEEIGRMLAEMQRILRPDGTMIILETLGTGRETPAPPTPGLAAYYSWLEDAQQFTMRWVRTDYQFTSVAEAEQLTRFFFGDALADRVLSEGMLILPECTGIWSRQKTLE
ncbi:MAG: class I SAM-dependent methyltransferase [bacterium]|nr:class I SAM-dependent methyltransferase [bacterium]